jgi:hypothetical protein
LYVKSENNAADILNKHAVEKLHTKHATDIRNGTLNCWREDVGSKQVLATRTVHQSAHDAHMNVSSRTTARCMSRDNASERESMSIDDATERESSRDLWTTVMGKKSCAAVFNPGTIQGLGTKPVKNKMSLNR